jgi:acetylornithine/succinyldiaminopimelate/putrescine aminotransferase
MRVLQDENLVAHAAEVGAYFSAQLAMLAGQGRPLTEVRGRGLMLAAEIDGDASALVGAMRERGVLVNSTGPTTLRMVPPLILTRAEVDEAVGALAAVLAI